MEITEANFNENIETHNRIIPKKVKILVTGIISRLAIIPIKENELK